MRTDGIQEASSEPEPDDAPSGSSADGSYNGTRGRLGMFDSERLPPNVEPISPEGKRYLVNVLDRLWDAIKRWDPWDPRNANRSYGQGCQLRKGKAFLELIEKCLLKYMMSKREEGTFDMLDSVEDLLLHATSRMEERQDMET